MRQTVSKILGFLVDVEVGTRKGQVEAGSQPKILFYV